MIHLDVGSRYAPPMKATKPDEVFPIKFAPLSEHNYELPEQIAIENCL